MGMQSTRSVSNITLSSTKLRDGQTLGGTKVERPRLAMKLIVNLHLGLSVPVSAKALR